MYANRKDLVSRKARLEFRKRKVGKVEAYWRGILLWNFGNIFLRFTTTDLWNKQNAFFKPSKVVSPLKGYAIKHVRVFFLLTFVNRQKNHCRPLISRKNLVLRMLYVYTSSQKFNTIRVSVLRDTTKVWKKSSILRKSKTYIWHNNNAKK